MQRHAASLGRWHLLASYRLFVEGVRPPESEIVDKRDLRVSKGAPMKFVLVLLASMSLSFIVTFAATVAFHFFCAPL